MSTRLDDLIDVVREIRAERDSAQTRLDKAEQLVLEERFKDVEKFKVDDIILVPRKLFGETRWWPAKIIRVNLNYSESWMPQTYEPDPGGHREHLYVSYGVVLKQKDGSFGGSTEGFRHDQVQAAPA